MTEDRVQTMLALTADIVVAQVANSVVAVADVAGLIQQVHLALTSLGEPPAAEPAEPHPAVPIRSSVRPDHIVCLEDGRKLKMLRRYLRTRYDMSPEQYRAKWKLPDTYPMVAPDYAEQRRTLAHAIGLGRRPAPESVNEPVTDPTPTPAAKSKKRGRKPAAKPAG